jgi:hypothetical protein
MRLPSDEDGFLSRECPTCLQRFKAPIVEGSVAVNFCPYCGHEGSDCWWTPAQLDYAKSLMTQQVIGPELDSLAQEVDSMRHSFIKISLKRSPPVSPIMPTEHEGPSDTHTFPCCGARVKFEPEKVATADGRSGVLTCIQCGTPDAHVLQSG